MNIFSNFFGKNKKKESIEVKNLTHSNVNILQTDVVNISSLFSNNPYNDIIIKNAYSYDSSLASLAKNISYRTKTIESILKKWNNHTWMNIYGGYDTGKSQLSLLIGGYLKYDCLSFSFKDISQNEFKNIVSLVFTQILNHNFSKINNLLIIFDDLPQLGYDDNINTLFLQLFKYCEDCNIKILSTSNYKIHYKIVELTNNNFVELLIPRFNKEEIEEIILTYNDAKSTKKYSTIIEAISSGYPIYVQIICKYLEAKNWILTTDEFSEFISGKEFNELDDETYQKLLHTTQNESAREILYRLNIISGTISIETIEIVSNANPSISSPFEKVSSLSGTWLQKNNDETYFISPLIKRLGSNNILYTTRKEINNKLAQNILSKKSLSQYDSQRAITYFLAGESFDDAGMVMIMALQSYFKQPEIFTNTIFGAFWIDTNLPEQMSSVTKLSIRVLQLHIYDDLQIKKHQKFKIEYKSFVRTDLEKLVINKVGIPNEIIELTYLILFKSYIRDDGKKSLYYFESLNDIGIEKFKESEQGIYDNLWMILDKIHLIDEISNWFKNYQKVGKVEEFYDNEIVDLFSRRLFDNIIDNNKDWRESIEILDFIENKALKNNIELLRAYSVKTKILILVEKLNVLSEAEKYFNDIQNTFKRPEAIFLIKDEFGRQQFYKGYTKEALLNLLAIENINVSKVVKLDTYLTIAKIFGEKDNNIAHTYTKKALDFAQNNLKVSKLTIAKLMGEYAISFWLLQDSKTSIYKLAECYELLLISYGEIDSFDNIDDYNIVVIQLGSTLNYVYQLLAFGKPPEKSVDGSEYLIPKRGQFNGNYDSKLLNEWYYEERKYMNSYILIQSFEYFGDKENAIKWANRSFVLNKEIILYTFKNSLRSFLVYKILQNKYQEAIEIEKELFAYENTINIEMVEDISNLQQREMFLRLLEKKPLSKDLDDYYLTFNLIPIILRELTLFLENKITEKQIIINLKEHLHRNEALFSDKKALQSIFYILDNYPKDYINSKKLISWINNIETENNKPIQVICYLICSLKAPSFESLKLHLALMPYLEKVIRGISPGSYLFILYPFIYKFWTSRILTNPQDFYFLELWQKNLNMSIDVKNEFKIVSIYTLVCMHLSYPPNEIEQNWMQPYIDFMVKTK